MENNPDHVKDKLMEHMCNHTTGKRWVKLRNQLWWPIREQLWWQIEYPFIAELRWNYWKYKDGK